MPEGCWRAKDGYLALDEPCVGHVRSEAGFLDPREQEGCTDALRGTIMSCLQITPEKRLTARRLLEASMRKLHDVGNGVELQ